MFKSSFFLRNAEGSEGAGGETSILTNEQIDKRNEFRKTQGLEPLPYQTNESTNNPAASSSPLIDQLRADKETELRNNNTAGLTEDQIREEAEKLIQAQASEIKAKQYEEEAAARAEQIKNGDIPVIKIGAKAPVVVKEAKADPEEEDVDEEILLKALSKKAGKPITSLQDFLNPTKELSETEKEQVAQKRENAKLTFGLHNNLISKKEVESFIADSSDPEKLVFEHYASLQKDIDANLTEAEIRENFEEEYGINEAEDSRKFKSGQKQIEFLSQRILAEKHSKYLNLEREYSAFESNQEQVNSHQTKVLSLAPSYKKDVEAVISRIGKVTLGGYEVELEPEILENYKNNLLDPQYSESIISKGWSIDELENSTRTFAIMDNLEAIVEGILKVDRLKNQAGQRGIIPSKNLGQTKIHNEIQDDARKELRTRLGMTSN